MILLLGWRCDARPSDDGIDGQLMGKMKKTLSVNMQPLCSSQCVVQWCSQTPKHVLLKLYDCTYCLLFYNHCKISSRMSQENIVIDVNIYLGAFLSFFFPFID